MPYAQDDGLAGAAALMRSVVAGVSGQRSNAGATIRFIHDVKSVVELVGRIEPTAGALDKQLIFGLVDKQAGACTLSPPETVPVH